MKCEKYKYGGGYGWELDEFSGNQKRCAILIAEAIEKYGELTKIECQTEMGMDCYFDWHKFNAACDFASWVKRCSDDSWADYMQIVMTFNLDGQGYEIHLLPSKSEYAPEITYRGSYDCAKKIVDVLFTHVMRHRFDGQDGLAVSGAGQLR